MMKMSTYIINIFAPTRQNRAIGQRIALLSSMTRVNAKTDKSRLASLRKKTGFSISNCKRALDMHMNNMEKAESWLESEAQAQGWMKATKLADRATSQGLVAVHVEKNIGVIVEINCETDFVARNEKFKALASQIAEDCATGCLRHSQEGVKKEIFNCEQLMSLSTRDGKCLGDVLALAIGNLGENMKLSRAVRITVGPEKKLVGYTHPHIPGDNYLTGKFGTILVLNSPKELTEVARQLCVHVIGMNPIAIGTMTDTKASNIEDETLFIHQEFLADPSKRVGEVLEEEDIAVIDYVRMECGESKKDPESISNMNETYIS